MCGDWRGRLPAYTCPRCSSQVTFALTDLCKFSRISRAQFSLGVCCYDGAGVAQDYAAAVSWLLLASQQGDAQAQCRLAFCYLTGELASQSGSARKRDCRGRTDAARGDSMTRSLSASRRRCAGSTTRPRAAVARGGQRRIDRINSSVCSVMDSCHVCAKGGI